MLELGWGRGRRRRPRSGPLPMREDGWLLSSMTATWYSATQNRTRAGTRLLPTPPDLSDISDRAVKDS